MNQREKEEYLREYSILKAQGKPFFPYAVAKDGAMACVVMAVIIAMSLTLRPAPSHFSPRAATLASFSRKIRVPRRRSISARTG